MVEETVETVEETIEPAVEDFDEEALEESVADVAEEALEASTSTMTRPTALLKPIRGTLQPLTEEEEVRTASLTPIGHMLVPEKKRGPPPPPPSGARQRPNFVPCEERSHRPRLQ